MRGRGGAAIVIAALFLLCSVPAGAQGTGARLLFFSGVDLWRHGSFLFGGMTWSPGGLNREGFTLKALLSGGRYDYISGALGKVKGRELVAQFLPGWRFKFGKTELKLFAGIDLQNHDLDPDDPQSGLRGGDTGLRAAFELWSEPTPDTMVAAGGSVTTIEHNYSIRAAVGWRVAGLFYAGPEVQQFACDGYRQRRIGVHLTAFKVRDLEWSAAAGFTRDSDDRDGGYVRLGISRRY
jgi:hypothetical protein